MGFFFLINVWSRKQSFIANVGDLTTNFYPLFIYKESLLIYLLKQHIFFWIPLGQKPFPHLWALNDLSLDYTYFSLSTPLFLIFVCIHPYPPLTLAIYYFQIFHFHRECNLLQLTAVHISYTFFNSDSILVVTILIFKLLWLWMCLCSFGYSHKLVQSSIQEVRNI